MPTHQGGSASDYFFLRGWSRSSPSDRKRRANLERSDFVARAAASMASIIPFGNRTTNCVLAGPCPSSILMERNTRRNAERLSSVFFACIAIRIAIRSASMEKEDAVVAYEEALTMVRDLTSDPTLTAREVAAVKVVLAKIGALEADNAQLQTALQREASR